MATLLIVICLPALISFAVPCCLSGRWLGGFTVLTGLGLLALWRDELTPEPGSNASGLDALVTGGLVLLTIATGAGIIARLAMLELRRGQVRWRYAWLPAPAIFGLIVSVVALSLSR